MIAIQLFLYCVDVKSNMALYRCFKANASRLQGAAIVSFFNGTVAFVNGEASSA